MRSLSTIACLSLVALLAGCATPSDGYYDANGNWVPYNRYNEEAHEHSPLPGGTYEPSAGTPPPVAYTTTTTTYTYSRPGYYDYNGAYVTASDAPSVPQDMFPPRGMCRVWLPNRAPDDEPAIEPCDGINHRVPVGAYVIYGG